MSADTAIRCAVAFGVRADFWLALQANWDSLRLARAAPAPMWPPTRRITPPSSLTQTQLAQHPHEHLHT
jgi:plasmid maintenance system antidote protein VapI